MLWDFQNPRIANNFLRPILLSLIFCSSSAILVRRTKLPLNDFLLKLTLTFGLLLGGLIDLAEEVLTSICHGEGLNLFLNHLQWYPLALYIQ